MRGGTKTKQQFEILGQTSYRTHVELEMKVTEVLDQAIRFEATLIDFMGYERDDDDDDKDEDEDDGYEDDEHLDGYDGQELQKKSSLKEMYKRVREETKYVKFHVLLGMDGTVLEMETSKLRAKIISALHEAGQLPMHLEHALVVDGTDVFPANGAAFGPMGRTRVKAPVFMLKQGSRGCDNSSTANYQNRIVVVDRGGCSFQEKAAIAAKFEAVALIVVDRTSTQNQVVTYMNGEGDVPIVSVLCNNDAGEAIEAAMRNKHSPVNSTELIADNVVEILGGLEAVKALNSQEFEQAEGEPLKPHHLNPVHTDGLNDYVGIGYLLDEIIRNRFSIFPSAPVTIGASWQRDTLVSDKINPDLQALVKETYKLASVTRAEEDFAFGRKGDLIAELHFTQREAPLSAKEKLQRTKENKMAVHAGPGITPQFGRPALRGHSFVTDGVFQLHLHSGLVFSGRSTSHSSSMKSIVVDNKDTGKKQTVNAKVTLIAQTAYAGTLVL